MTPELRLLIVERSRRGCEVVTIGQNSSCIKGKEITFDGENIKGSICYCNNESLCNGADKLPSCSLMILAAWSCVAVMGMIHSS